MSGVAAVVPGDVMDFRYTVRGNQDGASDPVAGAIPRIRDILQAEIRPEQVFDALTDIVAGILRQSGWSWIQQHNLHCGRENEGYVVSVCSETGLVPVYLFSPDTVQSYI